MATDRNVLKTAARAALKKYREDYPEIARFWDDAEIEANRVRILDRRYELLARAECRRQGIAPDESISDGGDLAWQLVGHEAAEREAKISEVTSERKDNGTD